MRRDEMTTAALWLHVLGDVDPDTEIRTLLTDRAGALAHAEWGADDTWSGPSHSEAWAFRDGSVLEHREAGGRGWVEGDPIRSVATIEQVARALGERARIEQMQVDDAIADEAADIRAWARDRGC